MNLSPKKSNTPIIILLVLIIILAIALVWHGHHGAGSASGISSSQSASIPESPSAASDFASCKQQLVAQAQQTSFATATVLVAFTPTTTWPEAESILAAAGASTTETIEDFSVNGIIQADVLPGEEISTACTLRANAGVRYAGLNSLFTLAQ